MPHFISKGGKWFPAKESVSLKYNGEKEIPKDKLSEHITIHGDTLKPGDHFLYNGPDRGAMQTLLENDVETLGQDFRYDPELIQVVRHLNFRDMDAYLKFQGYDEKAANKDFEEKAMKVNRHELPETQEELIISQTGGKDTSGNYKNDLVGGFGEQEIKKRAEVAKPKKKIKL